MPAHRRSRARTPGASSPVLAFDRWLAGRILTITAPAGVGLTLWDGHRLSGDPPGLGQLVIRDRGVLLGLALHPSLYFGEHYMSGRLEIDGPFEPVLEALSRASLPTDTWREHLLAALTPPASLSAARRNIHEHYDLGNDFYARWLDRDMLYTCAYFAHPDVSLEDAQIAKLDRVCRKLHLRPGDRVVDAGCGWGGFALYAARTFGCHVAAFNVSREQLAYARARARREGLESLVTFVDDDYRNISGTCDAFVSLGMLEHVGPRQYDDLARVLRRTVAANGRGLLHFIGRDAPYRLNAWVRRRIFPGAYPPTLAQVTTGVLAPARLSVVDVENLRLHYAQTLAHWYERYEAAADDVRQQYGDTFRRAWALYLAASQAAFASGWLQLYQVVFTPVSAMPPWWTRDDALATETPRC